MALLHGTRRTATCRALTPSALYELRRNDIDVVRGVCPEIQRALEEAESEAPSGAPGVTCGTNFSGRDMTEPDDSPLDLNNLPYLTYPL